MPWKSRRVTIMTTTSVGRVVSAMDVVCDQVQLLIDEKMCIYLYCWRDKWAAINR
jgi:hypothetical protein